jgi:hypothetical protein
MPLIRIDLQPPSQRQRVVVTVLGLVVAIGAFGGALYALDRQVPLGRLWSRALSAGPATPARRPVDGNEAPSAAGQGNSTMPARGAEAAPPVETQTVRSAPPVPPPASAVHTIGDGVLRGLAVFGAIPSGMGMTSLSVGESGVFTVDGVLHGVSVDRVWADFEALATNVEATSWTSGRDTTFVHCRVRGDLYVARRSIVDGPQIPLSGLAGIARKHGLTGISLVAGAAGEHGLRGRGTSAALGKTLEDLEGHGVFVQHLDIEPGPADILQATMFYATPVLPASGDDSGDER